MNKRIISVLLIICLTFSTSATVFAQNTSSTYIQNEQGKSKQKQRRNYCIRCFC